MTMVVWFLDAILDENTLGDNLMAGKDEGIIRMWPQFLVELMQPYKNISDIR